MPVRAWPIRSCPASAIGRVSAWMAKVRSMPTAASAVTIRGSVPSSPKVGASGSTGASAASGCEIGRVLRVDRGVGDRRRPGRRWG